MMIDPHVHCRDGDLSYKETIPHAFRVARSSGVEKLFDMPNTFPPIIDEKSVKKRLKIVPENLRKDYFLYVGLTSNSEQIGEAVDCYRKYRNVIGLKLYGCESVGDLSVPGKKSQRKVYETLSDLRYKGVLMVHCEKEEFMNHEEWDPQDPTTHSVARPKKAEIESVKDQIESAEKASFEGTMHVCHISCPETVDLLNRNDNVLTTCGVTPHHLLWTDEMLERPDGLLYKVNPPLRKRKDVTKLRIKLKERKIDWIESDHAPHSIGEKLFPPHCSGYPSLYLYGRLVNRFLPGIGLSNEMIREITWKNIVKIFGEKIID